MCSVVGCDSWRRGAQRFRLPEDPERRLQWVQFVLEVNGQRLKESSWTDITICSEHFPEESLERPQRTGTGSGTGSGGPAPRLQLRPGAVPSHVDPGKEKWTDGEVRVLLSLYGSVDEQNQDPGKRNLKVYAGLSEQMAVLGVHRTAKQCREKIKKLKQDYKKVKDQNLRSGCERKTNKWYEKMDAILGHKPEFCGVGPAGSGSSGGGLEGPEAGGLSSSPEILDRHVKTEALEPEDLVSEEGFCNDAPSACSLSTDRSASSSPCPPSSCTSPPRPSTSSCQPTASCTQSPPRRTSPRPARKRKREESSLQSLVKELLKKDEEDRRSSQETMQKLLALLNEQNEREAEERERQRAEAAEDRRRQEAFHKLLGMLLLRFSAAASQQPTHPALD